MAKTKEQIRKYNKEYSARPRVKEWARIRNARPERKAVRKRYKQSLQGKEADKRSRRKNWAKHAPLREKQLLWRYGLTPLEFQKMLELQSGLCAICSTPFVSRPHVDHNHKTQKVRGLLCSNCNLGLGLFLDNPFILKMALEYLQSHV